MRSAWIVALAACGQPVSPTEIPRDPAADGPWRVGVTSITAIDPVDDQELTIEVWYPATPADGAERETTLGIPTTSVRDAPVDLRGGPFPLIAFSHGNGGLRVQSVYLTEHLASWGYVVVAPDHPNNTIGSSNEHRPEVFRARPRQISVSIDAALAQVGDRIDGSRIAVAGHSFGGFTSLALVGGHVDVAGLRAACTADPSLLVCDGIDDELTQDIVDAFPDPRIAAAVALTPAGRVSFGTDGLAAITVPVQIQGGTLDMLATPAFEIDPIFDGLIATKSYGMLEGAAHFSFTDICALWELSGGAGGPLDFLTTEGCGDQTLAVERAHAASRTLAAAFFDVHVRGEPDELGYLAPGGVADATVR
jgi:predicted dienelactone hydrolase